MGNPSAVYLKKDFAFTDFAGLAPSRLTFRQRVKMELCRQAGRLLVGFWSVGFIGVCNWFYMFYCNLLYFMVFI